MDINTTLILMLVSLHHRYGDGDLLGAAGPVGVRGA